jgi:polyhydroxybutyrate depolymerase
VRLIGTAGLAALAAAAAAGALPPASVQARAACGTSTASGSVTLTLGGHARTVLVHLPGGYTGSKRVPLVLNLHGSGSTASQQELFTGMDATADAHGFIVAYPQALIPDGGGFDWNVPGVPLFGGRAVPRGSASDVAFIVSLVRMLEHRYCVDARRVYATGFSGGARLTSELACDAAGVFAAVAPVSGLRRPSGCRPARAAPILSFHGTADPVDPYGGHGQQYWTYSVPVAARDWRTQEACAEATTLHPVKTVTVTRYARCRDGSTVELYTIAGEGHEWPGGSPLPKRLTALLGPQSDAVDADDVMWAFFAAHALH